MIIEDLIRLGKPLLQGEMDARDILELISDVTDKKVKNFFRHVFIVELPPDGSDDKPVALPMQVWGQEERTTGKRKKVDFKPDVKRVLGVPFVLPTGGSPLNPQGSYGVPVFPCWDRHLREFQHSTDLVRRFLEGRLARTPSINLDSLMVERIAKVVHDRLRQLKIGERDKVLGIIVRSFKRGLKQARRQAKASQKTSFPFEDSIKELGKAYDLDWASAVKQTLYHHGC